MLVLILATSLAYAAEPPIRYESSVDAMGSTFSIAAWGSDRDSLAAAVESALEEARRVDRLLSNYRPDSEWSAVNRSAAEEGVTVSQELFDLLAACVRYSEQSEGTFDITVGPLMRVWGFYKDPAACHTVRKCAPRWPELAIKISPCRTRHEQFDLRKRASNSIPAGSGRGMPSTAWRTYCARPKWAGH